MDAFLQDVRSALRALRARPRFAAAVILTLSLGIGANTAIFSVVHSVLLRQLPYGDPGRLYALWNQRTDGSREGLSIPDFEDLRAAGTALESAGAVHLLGMNLTGEGDPERIFVARTSAGFFETLAVAPALGRPFMAGEIDSGAHVALLTDALWRRRFGGDPSALGRSIVLGDESYEVVGVLPRGFLFPGRSGELAIPLALRLDPRANRRADAFLRAFARVRPSASPETAAAQLTDELKELARKFPDDNARKQAALLVPVADELVGRYRSMLLLMLGAVALVLAMTCANLASLMLAQAEARRREFAVRSALGAVRKRVLRQVLIESVVLAILGGALGSWLATHLTRGLVALSPQQIPRMGESGVDGMVLAFALALSLGSGILAGLLPAFQAARTSPLEGLGDGRASAGPSGARSRRILVATEIACSIVLLSLAGLLARSFAKLQDLDVGFERKHVLTARLSLPPGRYNDAAALARFAQDLRDRVRGVPGVTEVATSHSLPFSGVLSTVDFTIEGKPLPRREEIPELNYHMVSPGLFRTLGIRLLAGREFDERDGAGAPAVIIVSQKLAATYFPGQPVVGRRIRIDDGAQTPRVVEVIGVAADVAHDAVEAPRTNHAYVPVAQVQPNAVTYARNMFLVVRTAGDPLASAKQVLAAVHGIDSLLPASNVQTMDRAAANVLAPRRFSLLLVEVFGGFAFLLAALGVYALTWFTVERRSRELGIRLALGAAPRRLVSDTIADALRPVLVGLCAGLACALAAGRFAAGMLYRISPADPLALALPVLVLTGAAIAAAWIPARRVAAIDAMNALRVE
jgi:putative ABC transport system permease protein